MIREHAVWGQAHVTDTIDIGEGGQGERIRLRRHALAFSQGNRYLLEALVRHVIEQLPRDVMIFDLYAGGGLFSIAAATCRGARVTAVEGDRFAAADLTANATASNAPVTALHAAVEVFLSRPAGHADVIIVDPPRTGMSREALDGVLRLRPQQIVYVSCDVATLARDARRMVDGGYTIDRADAFDLFPNTPHVECVVDLRI
jgi:tRNA/tmRNA/rRNA uracil-C5-methylase (TrmA/RlmC/RlmD family)